MRRLPGPPRAVLVAVAAIVVFGALACAPAGCAAPPRPATPAPSPASAEIRVFLIPAGADPCGTVVPVVRTISGPVGAEVALREVLAGPTLAEAAAGYSSIFGPATADALLDVAVIDGIARVSFRDLRQVIPNASSSCGSAALLGALDATITDVPGIRGARYSFDGDEAAFYEWLQMAPPD
jgi:hypothetical protein